MSVRDHVEHEHCLDSTLYCRAKLRGKMTASVEAVGSRPALHRLLPVEEDEPVLQLVAPSSQHACHLQQKSSAGRSVIGPEERHGHALGIVMAGENDHRGR